ncbi:MAG: class I SAM-dependent methyltransferase [Candidatus Binataceae bacterium]
MPSPAKSSHNFADRARDFGTRIDWGKTAADYGRHRAGFPPAFFERLAAMGTMHEGAALDLGCGTGTIARGLAAGGMRVTGLDRSDAMMEEAARLDREAGVAVRYVNATAEATGLAEASFDLVTAGQCWHWFDRPRAAAEAMRVLRPGGRIVIAHFDWIPTPGNVVEATEELIEKFNPEWKLRGGSGIYPQWFRDLDSAGFKPLESFSFDSDAIYTREAWRGRIRASAGVGAALSAETTAAFDAEMMRMLESRFPADPISVHHRVSAVIGTRP